jgi:hypothetical protein
MPEPSFKLLLQFRNGVTVLAREKRGGDDVNRTNSAICPRRLKSDKLLCAKALLRARFSDMRDPYFGSHEFWLRTEAVKLPSDRVFGLVFGAVFALLCALSLWHHSANWLIWFFAAMVVLIAALAFPRSLRPFNAAWMKFGILLQALVGPLALGVLFFLCITPIGIFMRLSGRDPLRRRYDADTESYWIIREPPGPYPDFFRNQF